MKTPYIPKFKEYVQENGKIFTFEQRKLINEKEVKKYIKNFIKYHTFFSPKNAALDFIYNKLEYKNRITSKDLDNPFRMLSRKLKLYISHVILPELIESGILIKYNTKNYKIIKNLDISLIEV